SRFHPVLPYFPTRRSSDLTRGPLCLGMTVFGRVPRGQALTRSGAQVGDLLCVGGELGDAAGALPLVLGERSESDAAAQALLARRSEEHTSELQSRENLVCS